MNGLLILFAFSFWLLWLYYCDSKERASVSSGSWLVVAWAVIFGSRPVTEWFSGADQGLMLSSSMDEGNTIESAVSLSLIVAGLIVLLRRGVSWSVFIRDNIWLVVFYLFWLISVSWSDYPLITFKRLFKDLGNIVLLLVVLTDKEPIVAIKAVLSRVAYLCIPLSILLIRYYPEWGRGYVGYERNEVMWIGVTTHKNTLGVLAFIGAIFLLWDLLDLRGKRRSGTGKFVFVSRAVVLLMCWYLLVIANSATSLVCAVIGSAMLIALGLPSVRQNLGRFEAFGLGAAALLVTFDSIFNIKELFVTSLGRDMSLTTRTDVWPILIAHQDNPLVGAGFNTFWAGSRLVQLREMVGGIIQAHNGYLETYLNGGFIGGGLLVILLLSSYARLRKQFALHAPEAKIRFVLLVLAIIYNFTEASFNKVGLLWLVTLYSFMEYRAQLYPQTIIEKEKAFGFSG